MKKTVYFLGAGASAGSDFQLPTMEGFFKSEDFQDNQFHDLKKFIKTLYPTTPFKDINLEDVITHLELSLEGFGDSWEESKTLEQGAKKDIYKYIVKRLSINSIDGKGYCEKHKKLLAEGSAGKQITSRDTIASLNYDLVVEESYKAGHGGHGSLLRRMKELLVDYATIQTKWELLDSQYGEGYFLKLHGSIDWLYCPNPSCKFHQQIHPATQEERDLPNICSSCGRTYQTVIVPPTIRKSYEKFPKIGLLWRLAYEELKKADSLIMIGMSLPDSDYYLKWLLKESMRKRKRRPELTIVNTDRGLIQKTKNIIGVKKANWYNGFKDFFEKEKGEAV